MGNKLFIFLILLAGVCKSQLPATVNQHNLSKRVSFEVKQRKVSEVLQQMSNAGNFYFAYNGALFNQDSLVNLKVKSLPVRDVLDQLFDGKVDYKENEKYIILRYAVNHLTIEAENIVTAENFYSISGFVVDTQTGKRIKQASVYEKRLLQSALSDNDGYFTLKFKGEHSAIVLTASKESYRDTSLVFLASVNIGPKEYADPEKEKGTFFANTFDNLGIGRFFLSSKQKIQNINIPNFLANTPFQASLTPGLSSHGMMSSSVVNKISLNVLGGYTAGVDGVEVAGIFNVNKGNVKSVQVAGLFNAVGGDVYAVQVAGLHNDVHQDMKGVQIAGANRVKGNAAGVQVSALSNIIYNNFRGVQVTGLANMAKKEVKGAQIAALANMCGHEIRGIQIAGLLNYAKNNKGLQIGLINIADTSSGASLGLVNLVKTGYHKIEISTNELINANLTIKTGNARLYTILFAGNNFSDTAKIQTFGLGFGHDFRFGKRFSIGTVASAQHLHLGNWDDLRLLTKFHLNFQLQLVKGIGIYAGPTLNYYISDAPSGSSAVNYQQKIAPTHSKTINGYQGWLGFNVGISVL